jgi:GTP-binding protein SAR1
LLTRQTTGKALGPIAKDSGIRPLEFFMCSVLKEYGYQDALKWLTNYVEDKPVGQ